MKERPIIFSGAMVKAILDGRKTQTRRVVKPQPQKPIVSESDGFPETWYEHGVLIEEPSNVWKCPYGMIGDKLWVRETFWHQRASFDEVCGIKYKDEDEFTVYRADYDGGPGDNFSWKPSIFMPKILSRITLEITDVRVQRLQEISEQDAIAEGVEKLGEFPDITPWRNYGLKAGQPHCLNFSIARRSFQTLWDSINAKRGYGWDSNPWVWAIMFRQLEGREWKEFPQ